jgi:hypothetical protein
VESNRRYTRPDPKFTIHIPNRLASAAICAGLTPEVEIVQEFSVLAVALAWRITWWWSPPVIANVSTVCVAPAASLMLIEESAMSYTPIRAS